jgi:hypothetical protein
MFYGLETLLPSGKSFETLEKQYNKMIKQILSLPFFQIFLNSSSAGIFKMPLNTNVCCLVDYWHSVVIHIYWIFCTVLVLERKLDPSNVPPPPVQMI